MLISLFLLNEKNKRCAPKVFYVKSTGSYNAMTIPPFGIFINEAYRHNRELLNHELVHWMQYQRMGLIKFTLCYLKENINYGYDGNRMEMEARSNEPEHIRRNYTHAVRTGQARTIYDPRFRM